MASRVRPDVALVALVAAGALLLRPTREQVDTVFVVGDHVLVDGIRPGFIHFVYLTGRYEVRFNDGSYNAKFEPTRLSKVRTGSWFAWMPALVLVLALVYTVGSGAGLALGFLGMLISIVVAVVVHCTWGIFPLYFGILFVVVGAIFLRLWPVLKGELKGEFRSAQVMNAIFLQQQLEDRERDVERFVLEEIQQLRSRFGEAWPAEEPADVAPLARLQLAWRQGVRFFDSQLLQVHQEAAGRAQDAERAHREAIATLQAEIMRKDGQITLMQAAVTRIVDAHERVGDPMQVASSLRPLVR